RRLDLHGAQAVSGHVQHIVDAAHDPEVAVGIALCAVAREIIALEFGREIAAFEALGVAPDRTYHAWPGALHRQEAARARRYVIARLIDDGGRDAGQRQRARTRFERRDTWKRRDHVRACLGLPPGV